MNPNQNRQIPAGMPPGAMLNADFSMTNIEEVKEDIARDIAPIVPPSFQDVLQPGFAGTKATKVRQEIQKDLQKAKAKRMQ
jgi:hypothetical protein